MGWPNAYSKGMATVKLEISVRAHFVLSCEWRGGINKTAIATGIASNVASYLRTFNATTVVTNV